MRILTLLLASTVFVPPGSISADDAVEHSSRYELSFESSKSYQNPLYDIDQFGITLTSPTGRVLTYGGFWDGGKVWKIRFAPDELGSWKWITFCSDEQNSGLHLKSGAFECVPSTGTHQIYSRGGVRHLPGRYHLSYGDGTPFFWLACTAWNGGLLAEMADWDHYLANRRELGYSAIQFVTTQWRGGTTDRNGDVAFTGSGRIEINPGFFRRMDKKVDRINDHGLVAVPVLLWALPFGSGRQFSPGYYLPVAEAEKLARYVVARYQGNQVVWFLGGDGKYDAELEDRWKTIGDHVFSGIAHAPATLHPHGRLFVGDLYAEEPWYSIMGYQSSHGTAQGTVDWINKGPVARFWSRLRPMPLINIEPLYENILENQTEEDVRNAIWWSLLAAPVAGVTYGANGIWSWLEEDGQQIQNHRTAPWTVNWKNSLKLPVGRQMQHVRNFFQRLSWWELYPRPDLLVEQPGGVQYNDFIPIVGNDEGSLLVAYVPMGSTLHIRNIAHRTYRGRWFDPVLGLYQDIHGPFAEQSIQMSHDADYGMVLLLQSE